MIVLNDGLAQVYADNPDKKVGKTLINKNIFNNKECFHKGHKNIISALRNEGCEIIVFEVLDTEFLYNKIVKNKVIVDDNIYDHTYTINYCNDFLDIDYLIFTDVSTWDYNIPIEITQLINNRLLADDYKKLFQLTDIEYRGFKNIVLWGELRPPLGNLTNAYVLDGCFRYHAFKFYREKYSDINIVLLDNTYDKDGIHYVGHIPTLKEFQKDLNKDIRLFSQYFNSLTDIEMQNEDLLNNKASSLNGTITSFRKFKIDNDIILHIVYQGQSNAHIKFEKRFNGGV